MDFANKACAQLAELFRTMTPAARITSTLLLALVVISLAYLFRFRVSSADAYLLAGHHFTSSQLARVESAFSQAGLDNYQLEGNRVRIPDNQRAQYVAALAEKNALPPGFFDHLDKMIGETSVWSTNKDREQNWKIARQKELSNILRNMSGIQDAVVVYDDIEGHGLTRKRIVTASIQIWPNPNNDLEETRVEIIRDLVAGSIAGLSPENITVTDMEANRGFPGGGSGGPAAALRSPYAVLKRHYESEWVRKIRKALDMVPGVVVEVNVELNPDAQIPIDPAERKHVTKTLKNEFEQKTESRMSATTSDRAGQAANARRELQSVNISQNQTGTKNRSYEITEALPSYDRLTVQRAGHVPKTVTVAVGVPSSYYVKVWQERNPGFGGQPPVKPKTEDLVQIKEEQKSNIQNMVEKLLPPPQTGEKNYPMVAVSTFQHLSTSPPQQSSFSETAMDWLARNWGALAMTFVGLISLVMVRSMVNSIPKTPPTASFVQTENKRKVTVVSSDAEDDITTPELAETSSQHPPTRKSHSAQNLQDQLAEMVRDDPDAAVNILNNWIGNAG